MTKRFAIYTASQAYSVNTENLREWLGSSEIYMRDTCLLVPDCYVRVSPEYHVSASDIASSFSLSAWLQPRTGTQGYVLAKTTQNGNRHFYSLYIMTVVPGAFRSTKFEFRYSSRTNPVGYIDTSVVFLPLNVPNVLPQMSF